MDHMLKNFPTDLNLIIMSYFYGLDHFDKFKESIKLINSIYPWTSIELINSVELGRTNFMFTFQSSDGLHVRDFIYGSNNKCTFYTKSGDIRLLPD